VTLKNISTTQKSKVTYLEEVTSPFVLDTDKEFTSGDGYKASYEQVPDNYSFIVP
jgi:hypothetical protein